MRKGVMLPSAETSPEEIRDFRGSLGTLDLVAVTCLEDETEHSLPIVRSLSLHIDRTTRALQNAYSEAYDLLETYRSNDQSE